MLYSPGCKVSVRHAYLLYSSNKSAELVYKLETTYWEYMFKYPAHKRNITEAENAARQALKTYKAGWYII